MAYLLSLDGALSIRVADHLIAVEGAGEIATAILCVVLVSYYRNDMITLERVQGCRNT